LPLEPRPFVTVPSAGAFQSLGKIKSERPHPSVNETRSAGVLLNCAGDRGKGIICVGADHANRANDENQNHGQQYGLLGSVLAAIIIPEFQEEAQHLHSFLGWRFFEMGGRFTLTVEARAARAYRFGTPRCKSF